MNENPVLKLDPFKVPESNVFLMTRFRNKDRHNAISAAVAEAIRAFGLAFIRADDPNISEKILWQKVRFCMEASHFGVAVFENIDEPYFNPNISFELGYMMGLKREYLLLKEKQLKTLHSDLCGHLYKEFDSDKIQETILGQIADWFKSNGVRKRDNEKLVVFVSYGGQDRCAIAKVITKHLLLRDGCTLNFRVESRAAFNPSGSAAAKIGIEVVREKLGKDLLGDHRPRGAGAAFLFEADLILASDHQVLSRLMELFKTYPGTEDDQSNVRDEIQQKTYLLSEFFGGTGDIEDPYQKSKSEYERCFDDLYRLISSGLNRLTAFLEKSDPLKTKLRNAKFGDRLLFGTEANT